MRKFNFITLKVIKTLDFVNIVLWGLGIIAFIIAFVYLWREVINSCILMHNEGGYHVL